MNPILYGSIRTGIQMLWGLLVSHFTVLAAIPNNTAVDWIMTAVVGAGYTGLSMYLQTRTGTDIWSKAARFIGRIMMLGLVKTPSYPKPPTPDSKQPVADDPLLDKTSN